MTGGSARWYLRTQDETFGPESEAKLVEWARMGRIQPGQEVSDDNIVWKRVEDVPFLDMRFSIDLGDGNPRGPFNRAAAAALLASGRLPKTATMVEVREPFKTEEPVREPVREPAAEPAASADQPRVVEKVVEVPVEKVVEKEVRVEVPVEKIVEKIVEVEKRVEVPVEKIVEKIVEVEKPPRTTVVVPEVVEPSGNEPPRRAGGAGLFGDVSRSGLAALEQAARRELAAAGKNRFGFFGRRKA